MKKLLLWKQRKKRKKRMDFMESNNCINNDYKGCRKCTLKSVSLKLFVFFVFFLLTLNIFGGKKVEAATAMSSFNTSGYVVNNELAQEAGDYYLTANITSSYGIWFYNGTTIDLKGKTMTLQRLSIYSGATVVFKDSVGGGKIVVSGYSGSVNSQPGVPIENNGYLYFDNVRIEAGSARNDGSVIWNKGQLFISNCTVIDKTRTTSADIYMIGTRATAYSASSSGTFAYATNTSFSRENGTTNNYLFKDTTSSSNALYVGSNVTTSNIKYTTPQKTATQYTITYYDGSSKISNLFPTYYLKGAGVNKLPKPEKTNYVFEGWYTNSSFTGSKVTSISSSDSGNKTYYAKWSPKPYNISYYHGSTKLTGLTPSTYTYGTGATLPSYSKTGYTFGGWYASSSLSGSAVTKIGTTDTGNKTYYAKMTPNSYTITYELNGGTQNSSNKTSYTYGTGVTLYNPTKNGYTFEGWYTTSTFTGSSVSSITKTDTGDKTLYAKWSPSKIKLTFDANGGTGGPTTLYYIYNTNKFYSDSDLKNQVTTLTKPTRTGYTLVHYYGDGTSGGVNGERYALYEGIVFAYDLYYDIYKDATLYAKWSENTYNITYYNGSTKLTDLTPKTYKYGTGATLPTYSQTNYTFGGWYTNSSFTGSAVTKVGTTDYGDKTYYAKMTPNSYTITYNLNGGTQNSSNKDTYTYGTGATLYNPTKTGYTFGGWYTKSDFSGSNVSSISKTDTGNKTYYAKWTANTYTVTLNSQSATTAGTTSVTGTYGSSMPKITAPTKKGYTFGGYYTATNGSGTQYYKADGTSAKNWDLTADTTLYAKWTASKIKITFDAKGGTGGPTTLYFTYGINKFYSDSSLTNEVTTLTKPTKTGYTLLSYYGDGTSGGINGERYFLYDKIIFAGDTSTDIYKDATMYANWTESTYNVTYYNGSTKLTGLTPATYKYGTGATLPTYSQDDYVFGGWYTNSSFTGSAVTKIGTTESGDKTYYVKMIPSSFKITYELNGGTQNSSNKNEYEYGKGLTLYNPTKTGYTFAGWYTTSTFTGSSVSSISKTDTGDKTLYAKWTPNKIKLTFDAKGGTGGPTTLYFTYGVQKFYSDSSLKNQVTTLTKPTKTGYTLVNYYGDGTSGGNNGERYLLYDGIVFASDLSTDIYKDATMYAKWTESTYNITYYNGSTKLTDLTPKTYKYGTGATLPTYSQDNYTFGGWYTNSSFTGSSVTKIGTTDTGDKTYYAKMTPNSYTITYNLNGGTQNSSNKDSYTYGTGATLYNPTKTGYTFGGWFTKSDFSGSNVTSITKTDTGNKTLYAKWIANTYKIYFAGNGGDESTIPSPITRTYGQSVTFPSAVPIKTGYTFGGWLFKAFGDVRSTATSTATKGSYVAGATASPREGNICLDADDATYVATWAPNKYTVTLNNQSATTAGTESVTATYGANMPVITKPTKIGYNFAGYYTSKNGGGTKYYNADGTSAQVYNVVNDMTLYAKWDLATYTITLNNKGATTPGTTQVTATYTQMVPNITIPSKTGYTFMGYYSEEDGKGDRYYHINGRGIKRYELTSNTTLYAYWKKESYNVSYYYGKTRLTGLTPSMYNYGQVFNLPTYTLEGYQFLGWYENKELTGSPVTQIKGTDRGDRVFYAKMYNGEEEEDLKTKDPTSVEKKEYPSTGTIKEYIVPVTGTYKLQVWGAAGGYGLENGANNAESRGGYGGYASGYVKLTKGQVLYIAVGGQGANGLLVKDDNNKIIGQNSAGGYNGGGLGTWDRNDDEASGGGGGATHIALRTGLLSSLEDYQDDILIVAGGGGGGSYQATGGSGGGYIGESGYAVMHATASSEGGTQSTGYAFGEGQSAVGTGASNGVAGAGGGFYGGLTNEQTSGNKNSAGGGSGYIGNSQLFNKVMYGYNVTGSTETSTKTISTENHSETPIENYAKEGDGYAQIDLISTPYLDDIKVNGVSIVNFVPETLTYTVRVDKDVEKVKFDVTKKLENQIVSVTNDLSLTQGTNLKEITVTAPDGQQAVYKINVTFNDLSDTHLEDIRVNGQSVEYFDPDGLNYVVEIDDPDNINIEGIKGAVYQELTYSDDLSNQDIVATEYIDVKAPDNSTRRYTVVLLEKYKLYDINYYHGERKLEDVQPSGYLYKSGEVLPTTCDNPGYTLLGWYTTPALTAGTEISEISENEYGEKTVYGKFSVNQYTITYNTNGGSNIPTATYDYGATVTAPANPTKTGKVFVGWYADQGLTEEYEFTTMPAENITIYAKWELPKYTITWQNADGTNIYTETLYQNTMPKYDEKAYGIPEETRPASVGHEYRFTGWSPEISELTEDITYVAQYEEVISEYDITYYYGDEELNNLMPKTYTYGNGVEILPIYEKIGYRFVDWYNTPTFDENTEVYEILNTDYGDKVLYAKLEEIMYKISFETNGGTSVEPIVAGYGSEVHAPTAPTKEGNTFVGWYSDEDLTEAYTFTTMPLYDTKVYAKWNPDQISVTWKNANGTNIYTETLDYGTMPEYNETEYGVPSFEKNGYTCEFIGWDKEIVPAKQNITYTARFEETANEYNITYYCGEEALVELTPKTYICGVSETLPTYSRRGSVFNGWYENAEFTGNSITAIKTTDYGDKNYYAKMIPIDYTITYNTNGGSSVPSETHNYGDIITAPEEPTKQAKSFEGWYTDESLTQKFKFDVMPDANIILYAKWEDVKYTITWVDGNGDVLKRDEVTEGKIPVYIGTEPTKRSENPAIGYEFTGWNKTVVAATENTTYMAKFKEVYAKYRIWYKLEDEFLDLEPKTYTYGNNVDLPTYTCEYGEFAGWYLSEDFDEDSRIEEISTTDRDEKILYAKINLTPYTITYVLDGGENNANNPLTYTYGTEKVLENPSKPGNIFEGWYLEDTFDTEVERIEETDLGNKTFYAKWKAEEYDIEYHYEETTLEGLSPVKYTYGESKELPTYEIPGYEFKGWYSDVDLTQKVESITDEDYGNKVLYAKLEIGEYSIKYFDGEDEIADLTPNTYTYGESKELPTYEKEGYDLEGWYLDEALTQKIEEITTTDYGNKVLYANMIAATYNITYYNEDEELEITPNTYTYGVGLANLPDYVVPGKILEGWYTDEELTNKVESISSTDMGNKTFYANLESSTQYTIKYFDGEDEITTLTPNTYRMGSIKVLPEYEKEHYTFDGWYLENTFTTKVEKIERTDFGNKVFYAKLTPDTYTITYMNEEDEITTLLPTTYEYGDSVELPYYATSGTTLEGWYTDEELTDRVESITAGEFGNKVLYANLVETDIYTIKYFNGETEITGLTPTTYELGVGAELPYYATNGTTLEGWYSDKALTNKVESITSEDYGNKVFYVKLEETDTYTIKYYDGDNEITTLSPTTYELGVGVELPHYDAPGKTLEGWYLDKALTQRIESITAEDYGNKVLYAKLEDVSEYDIKYYDGETELTILTPITYEYGVGAVLPNYEKEGYTFNGWYRTEELTETAVNSISDVDYGDKVFYAKTTINQYTINFEENGGSEVEDITLDYGSVVTAPVNPTKAIHTFGGWYLDEEFTEEYEFSTMPAENITLYARWIVNQYTISFEENGGSEVADITLDYGATVTAPENPTRTGKTFAGWYLDQELTEEYEFSTMPAENITLYAKWEIAQINITWQNADGTTIYEETLEYGNIVRYDEATYGIPEETRPASVGHEYRFTGWSPEVSAATEDITYVAQYEEVISEYKVTYYYGETKLEHLEPKTYTYGDRIEVLPTYEKLGYNFIDWYTTPTFDDGTEIYEISSTDYGDKNLYAKLEEIMFRITFETNGGTSVEPIVAGYGSEVHAPTAPTKEGNTFIGWYSDEDFTEEYEFTTMPLYDTTIYANWNPDQINVTWQNANGTNIYLETLDYGTIPEYNEAEYGVPSFEKDGYTCEFIGWDKAIVSAKEDITYIANFSETPIEYTIRYYYDGEELSDLTPNTYLCGTGSILPTYGKTGYVFEGWYETQELIGTTITDISNEEYGDKNYYAKMTPIDYTITYETNGGSSVLSETHRYDEILTEPEAPTKPAKSFEGWYLDEDLTQRFTFERMPAENITLYANWEDAKYTITWVDGNGDVLLVQDEIEEGETPAYIGAEPTKHSDDPAIGYRFIGWDKVVVPATEDATYTAQFEEVYAEYRIWYKFNDEFLDLEPTTYTYGDSVTLPEYDCEYGEFEGWYLSEDFDEDTRIEEISATDRDEKILYAKVNLTPYNVTYVLYGGENNANNPTTYTYGTEKELETPTKSGNAFAGWYLEDTFDTKVERIEKTNSGNITFYAKWEAEEYDIEYYYGGTKLEGLSPVTYTYGESKELPIYEIPGYAFRGWYSDTGLTQEVESITEEDYGNKVFYAKLEIGEYSIKYFDGEDELTGLTPNTYTYGESKELPTYEKEGYDLEGWYLDEALTQKIEEINTTDYGNKVLYANMIVATYNITYYNEDEELEIVPNTYTYGVGLTKLPDYVVPGKVLEGWYTDAELTNKVESISSTDTGDKTFYAKLESSTQYTIKYYDGEDEITTLTPNTYRMGSIKVLPEYEKEHYTFDGWYLEDTFTTKVEKIERTDYGNKVFYAKLIPDTYTITYMNGNNEITTLAPTTYDYGYSVELPYYATRGTTLEGWYLDKALTNKVESITAEDYGDKVLYANLVETNEYTIKYFNGENEIIGLIPTTYELGVGAELPYYATNGTTLEGWYLDKALTSKVESITAEDYGNKVLYAKLEETDTYTIKYYNGDNEITTLLPTTYELGVGAELPDYELPGRILENWYTTSDFQEGTKIESITAEDYGNKVLYAKLVEKNEYAIKYYDGDSEITGLTPTTYEYGVGAEFPYYATNGTTLEGWYSNKALKNKVTSITAEDYGDKVLYANLVETNEYTIKYYDGETEITTLTPITYELGVGAELPCYATNGTTLEGWYLDKALTNKVGSITAEDYGNKVLYAKLEETDTYTIKYFDGNTEITGLTPTTYELGVGAELPDYELPGRTLEGWYSDKGLTQKISSITTEDYGNKVLYANLEETSEYTIKYYDGETEITSLTPTTYEYGVGTVLPDYSLAGKTLEGWYSDKGLTQKIVSITSEDYGNKVLYAKLEDVSEYTIKYFDGETEITTLTPTAYEYGVGTELPQTYEKLGYTFNGWYETQELTGTVVTSISDVDYGNKVFYAKTTVNEYSIEYYYNGEKIEDLRPNCYTYGVGIKLPYYATKGTTLEGWYTDEELTNKVECITTEDYGNKTLYANLVETDTYTIKYYDGDNEITGLTPTTYELGVGAELPYYAVPGKTLEGWYSNKALTNKVESITSEDYGDKVFYANLVETDTYTIKYYDGDNEITTLTPTTYEYGVGTELPYYATRGTTLEGWYLDEDLTDRIESIVAEDYGNKVLYANLVEVEEYSIKYYNGETEITGLTPNTYELGVEVELPYYATRGRTLEGWYTDAELTNKVERITTEDYGNKVFYANMLETDEYSIKYFDGETEITSLIPTTYELGKRTELPNYEKTGYTFEGWYLDKGLTTKIGRIIASDYGNKVLYAKTTVNNYNITYKYEDEELDLDPNTYTYGIGLTELPDYWIPGKTLEGWYTDESLTNKIESIATNDYGDKVLYANLEDVSGYPIKYYDGETEITDLIPTTYEYGVETVLPTYEKDGYTFEGWYETKELTGIPITSISNTAYGEKTFYAKVEIGEYWIKYFNEEDEITDLTPTTYKYGDNVELPYYATRGRTLEGWYSDAELTNKVESITAEDFGNKTLYANLVATNEYTIKYYDGETEITGLIPTTYELGVGARLPYYATIGTTLEGWYSDKVLTNRVESITAEDYGNKVLYANLVETNTYTIEYYDGDNEITTIDPTIYQLGVGTELPVYEKEGYTFNGWYETQELTGTVVTDISGIDYGNKVFYAKTTINQYTISFEENGGSTVADITADYGTVVTAPENPIRTGYTFDKWYADEELTTEYEFSTMPAENITVYAGWTINQYTIIFVDEDGTTELGTSTVDYGTNAIYTGETPTKEATAEFTYTFDKWLDEEGNEDDLSNVVEDRTVKASYKATTNKYTVTFVDEDGTTKLGESTVDYGTDATFAGETPTKEATAEFTYTFDKWLDEEGNEDDLSNVVENRTVKASYKATTNKYTVTFVDEDGTTKLGESTVDYGTNATFVGETPTKEATAEFTYTFDKWLDEEGNEDDLSNVVENRTVKASYTATKIRTIISGKVTTENWEGKHTATVTAYRTDDTQSPREVVAEIETNEDGTYDIEVSTVEEYDIVITKPGYLKHTITNIIPVYNDLVEVQDIELLAGDVVKTGEIEISDLVYMNNNIYKCKDIKCDLNEDGVVDRRDRDILEKNYSKIAQTEEWMNPNPPMMTMFMMYNDVDVEDDDVIDSNNIDTMTQEIEEIKDGEETEDDEEIETIVNNNTQNTILTLPISMPYTITSEYGERIHPITEEEKKHTGIDLVGEWHTPILSIADGEVVDTGVSEAWGNYVEIKHNINGKTVYSFYAHLSEIDVVVGQKVTQGEQIGLEGGAESDLNHGYSTGHHLHFEIRTARGYGNDVDPNEYIKF